MGAFHPKVDEYIERSEEFARPILRHLRQLIHDACPDAEESIKWSLPHFDYNGAILCILTSYKHYCAFTFHKSDLMSDPRLKENLQLKAPDRFLGKITSLSDLPPDDVLTAFLLEAAELNRKGIKPERRKSSKPAITTEAPPEFLEKLAALPAAREFFESQSPSFRKNYMTWIAEAKTDATRQKRIAQSLEWISEGKGRFWQYEK